MEVKEANFFIIIILELNFSVSKAECVVYIPLNCFFLCGITKKKKKGLVDCLSNV